MRGGERSSGLRIVYFLRAKPATVEVCGWPFRSRSQIAWNCHIGGMNSAEQRSDNELLLAARTCSEPFGVFYARHVASVLEWSGPIDGEVVVWARALGEERLWAVEDCRHVTRRLEQTLLEAGERLVRVPPRLTAPQRRRGRRRGKSDGIDALAVARAALQEPRSTVLGPARRRCGS